MLTDHPVIAALRRYAPTRHIGYSGALLALLGIVWVLIGAGLTAAGDAPVVSTLWPISWLPLSARASLWIGGGLVAIACAFRPRWAASDRIAWTLLYIPPAIRAIAYLWGWTVSRIDAIDHPGDDRGWSGFLLYVTICGIIAVASRWPDPQRQERAR